MNVLKLSKFLGIMFLISLLSGCASTEKTTAEIYKNKSAREILVAAEKALAKKKYADAAKSFEAIDSLYPFGAEAEKAQLKVIYACYKNQDFASALAAADRYIHLYPRSEHAPYAYYMKGIINLESGITWWQKLAHSDPAELELKNMQSAFSNFNELIRRFPDSIYVHDAQMRMIFIRNIIAQHELETANFYLARKAYVAALNRATYVVQHFQGAPSVEGALKVLVKSYQALGASESEAAARRILRMNFPLSVDG